MIKCAYCETSEEAVKAGKTACGSQRYKCKSCGRRFTPEPRQMYSDELRLQAVKLSVDGVSFRRIGRHLGVDHVTVMNWVKAYSNQLPDALMPTERPLHVVEMDELYTFIGKKKTGST
jgi:transposase-like protein